MNKITIIGLGLMGGSLAMALKNRTNAVVWGVDKNRAVVDFALSGGAIDKGFTDVSEALKGSDFIIIALYPKETLKFVAEYASSIEQGALVTDICGVKTSICKGITELAADRFYFVGGHPMAGKERSGFGAADPALFEGCNYIITPFGAPLPKHIKRIEEMALSIGAAKIVHTSPEHHDAMIAYTSQLPHIIAAAYVSSPAFEQCDGFTAGSFKDVSRVATINEEMWSQLFLENKSKLSEELEGFISHMQIIKNLVDSGQKEELKAVLRASRTRKELRS